LIEDILWVSINFIYLLVVLKERIPYNRLPNIAQYSKSTIKPKKSNKGLSERINVSGHNMLCMVRNSSHLSLSLQAVFIHVPFNMGFQ